MNVCAKRIAGWRARFSRVLPALVLSLLWFSLADAGDFSRGTPLFADSAPLVVTLHAPWRQFHRDGDSDERYPAALEYSDPDGRQVSIPVTVERRGKTRRALCDFPPIRLRFDRAATEGTLFEGQRSLKLTTHCSNSRRWEQYYVLEMLAYRINNLVTERSFRVRVLSITYEDDRRGRSDPDRFGFLLEHARDVARRNDMPRVREALIGPESYEPDEISRFMLFQYLIGNTDFSTWTESADERCCHNVRTIGTANGGSLYALPYDFDSAGLVNASYAAPHESLPIGRVTQRLYRGFCVHNSSLETVRREYLELEDEILDLVRNEPLLSSRSRRQALRYLEGFYTTLKDESQFSREITARCRR